MDVYCRSSGNRLVGAVAVPDGRHALPASAHRSQRTRLHRTVARTACCWRRPRPRELRCSDSTLEAFATQRSRPKLKCPRLRRRLQDSKHQDQDQDQYSEVWDRDRREQNFENGILRLDLWELQARMLQRLIARYHVVHDLNDHWLYSTHCGQKLRYV